MKNKTLFIISIILFIFDRIAKNLVITKLTKGTFYPIIDGILSFTHLENTGAAFSLFQEKQLFLITISIFIIIFILHFFYRNKLTAKLPQIGWGLILGGALGNLFDRVNYNYVIDFINLDFINFPVFNIADIAISLGVVIVGYYILFKEGKEHA